MGNKHFIEELDRLLAIFPSEDVLPEAPLLKSGIRQRANLSLTKVENTIGEASKSDYYQCSRERFLHSIMLTLENVKSGGKILDVGNAPGYLAIALDHLGYEVFGINLNKHWEATYPSKDWLSKFNVQAIDIEELPLPHSNEWFDGIIFTEVLEHIAITHPQRVLFEFNRILKKRGTLIFSTPNACNISNILALLTGHNIFWNPAIFYGSTDRHNREFTPKETLALFESTGFHATKFYGMNDHANWRAGANELVYELLALTKNKHSLIRNTIMGAFTVV